MTSIGYSSAAQAGARYGSSPLAAMAGLGHAVLRIGAALLFMEHGLQKLFGWFADDPPGQAAPAHVLHLFSLMGLAGVLETFGGLLLVLGLGVRPVAVIAGVEMIVAYAMVHSHMGAWPIVNHGELALLYLLIWSFLAAAGSGPFSLDGLLFRRKPAS